MFEDRLNLSGTNLQYSLSNQGNDCFSEALRDLDEHAHPSPSSLATNIIEVMEILLLFVSQKAVRCKCISQLSFTLINASCCRERHQVLRQSPKCLSPEMRVQLVSRRSSHEEYLVHQCILQIVT